MKQKLPFLFVLVIALCLATCKHKPNDDVAPIVKTTNTSPVLSNNVKDSICFAEEIQPLLISNCAKSGCHNDTAKTEGIDLTSYASTKATLSGNLLMQVIQDNGSLGMPPAPYQKLSASQIYLIQTWVNQGMKDGVDCQGPCDTTNITFSGTIFPIFQDNCFGCHNSTTPVMQNYADIKTQVDNGKISCTINHAAGCTPMPLNTAPLPACKIKQITKWILSGAPNN